MGGLLLALLQLGLLGWNASELGRHLEHYSSGPLMLFLLVLRGGGLAVGLGGVALGFARLRSLAAPGRWGTRLLLCSALALSISTLGQGFIGEADPRWLTRALFFTGLALAQAGWIASVWRSSGAEETHSSRVEVVAFNVMLSLFGLEAIATTWANQWPSPLLSGPDLPVRIAAVRDEPGRLHFGTPLNSGGYADDEFFAADSGDLVVAVLSDSFGIGVVPQRYGFASVAETALRQAVGDRYARVALHNFGVPGVALNVYLYVYETQALPLRPSLVVVCVFVGNDILEGYTFGTPLIERYRLQEWYVWNVARKLLILAGTSEDEMASVEAVGQREGRGAPFPAADDPSREVPTFSDATFLEIEQRRIEVTNPTRGSVARRYHHFFRGLDYFHEQLGDRLVIAILPDEFQVNDTLYEQLSAARPEIRTYPRDLPQQRIMAFCAERKAHCLDLLPALRAAEADGRTYHLRDTHFNARGNRVVGLALGEALVGLSAQSQTAR